jgi:hypothetical protein
LHPSVFTFITNPPSWARDLSAACIWSKGVAAGRAAGHLHGLACCEDPPLEVLTANRKIMPRCGIVVHYTNRLPTEQIVEINGIPCTSVERTIMDLCGRLPKREAAVVLDDALRKGLTTLGALDHLLFRTARRGRDGCGVLRELIKRRAGLSRLPDTPLETVIFELICKYDLPMPSIQHEIRDAEGRFVARPDFVYPDEKLIIEGHSVKWHSSPEHRAGDLRRHARLEALGYLIEYLMWPDATTYHRATAERLRSLLLERAP